MDEVINKLDGLINRYHTMERLNGEDLNTLLQLITSSLYFLETMRSEMHNRWNIEVKRLVDQGESVSKSENQAYVKYPDMYRSRRLVTSGYKVVEAIRSNISFIKQEMNNGHGEV